MDPSSWRRLALASAAEPFGGVRLLSPFDNSVIHRKRLHLLFDFDYRIECYLPKSKRIYGYFCLPILFGDRFVGRIDCKAHRARKRFEVKALHRDNVPLDEKTFTPLLHKALQNLAEFNGCEELDLL